ncbi:Ig-like domain-containing protein [Ruminiclostridium cellobioparum]|uniref:Ig-like domain-containing protein n=1 Tax=Ruminiclostridium cellobioparum TaxID=29355 RepID=UPI0028A62197|nr:Ig-like domain-containing protein [Ruminiclostridium cellobioparum]
MTDTQTVGKSYTLTIENLTDNSVLANPLGKVTRTFKGSSEDKTAPTVIGNQIKSKNNNLVEILFNDNNAMDAASLEDISNYSISLGNETLEVVSAKAADTKYPDGYKTKKVTLTTAAQELNKTYKIQIKGVTDEFGNALKQSGGAYTSYSFVSTEVDAKPPYVKKVEYKNDTTIKLTFDDEVNKATATDPTNYSFNKDIGSPIKAKLVTENGLANIVELTTPKLANNTTYTITINNVEDLYGNALSEVKVDVLATSGELDTTVPSMTYIYAANKQEIQVNFDEKVVSGLAVPGCPQNITVKPTDGTNYTGSAVSFNYVGVIDDGRTLVYRTTGALTTGTYVIASTDDRFTDLAGNKIAQYFDGGAPVIADRTSFAGNDLANERPTVYVEQVNVKKVKAIFSEPVFLTDFGGYTVEKGNTDIADTYQTEWNISWVNKFVSGKEYSFDFSGYATDLGGARAKDTDETRDLTYYTTYMEDSVAPTINTVTAVNKKTVEVLYDEELSLPGSYRIVREYYDNAGNTRTENVSIASVSKDGEKAIITTGVDLKLSYNYYLQTISGAVDVAGNRQEKSDEKINFNGSDVETVDLSKGVGINNATEIFVTATTAISNVTVAEIGPNNTLINIPTTSGIVLGDSNKKATVKLILPVLASKSYRATVYLASGATKEIDFDGITPDIGLILTRTSANTVDIKASGYTNTDFVVEAYATPTASAITAPVTNKAGTTDTFTITELGAAATEYYVVMKRADDSTVLYAAKLEVVIP